MCFLVRLKGSIWGMKREGGSVRKTKRESEPKRAEKERNADSWVVA